MISARIANATRYLGAPLGWKPDEHGDCCHLAIQDLKINGDVPAMMSVWEPTPDELKRLNAGAKVSLLVVGTVHPPVSVSVGIVPDEGRAQQEGRG